MVRDSGLLFLGHPVQYMYVNTVAILLGPVCDDVNLTPLRAYVRVYFDSPNTQPANNFGA